MRKCDPLMALYYSLTHTFTLNITLSVYLTNHILEQMLTSVFLSWITSINNILSVWLLFGFRLYLINDQGVQNFSKSMQKYF